MEDRDKFLWRPNDNSVTTRLRYDLEAAHWIDSIKNATPSPTPSFSETMGTIGLLISFTFNIVFFIVLILVDIIKYFIGVRKKYKERAKIRSTKKVEKRVRLQAIEKKRFQAREKIEMLLSERPYNNISKRDSLFKNAALMVVKKQKVSISLLQFELGIGFERVSIIIDELEAAWIIAEFDFKLPRMVLIPDVMSLDIFFDLEKKYNDQKPHKK